MAREIEQLESLLREAVKEKKMKYAEYGIQPLVSSTQSNSEIITAYEFQELSLKVIASESYEDNQEEFIEVVEISQAEKNDPSVSSDDGTCLSNSQQAGSDRTEEDVAFRCSAVQENSGRHQEPTKISDNNSAADDGDTSTADTHLSDESSLINLEYGNLKNMKKKDQTTESSQPLESESSHSTTETGNPPDCNEETKTVQAEAAHAQRFETDYETNISEENEETVGDVGVRLEMEQKLGNGQMEMESCVEEYETDSDYSTDNDSSSEDDYYFDLLQTDELGDTDSEAATSETGSAASSASIEKTEADYATDNDSSSDDEYYLDLLQTNEFGDTDSEAATSETGSAATCASIEKTEATAIEVTISEQQQRLVNAMFHYIDNPVISTDEVLLDLELDPSKDEQEVLKIEAENKTEERRQKNDVMVKQMLDYILQGEDDESDLDLIDEEEMGGEQLVLGDADLTYDC